MAVADIIQHVAVVQEVMRAVMKPDIHYGTIPGTPKPSLYKQGAEVLCMVFRVADSYQVEDLSTADVVRYRVTCIGTHQMNGVTLGTGMGEASSGEEKYKWRKAYDDEFDATPANLRRIKVGKYKTKQIRTEPADLANTILKMANKRAKVAMTINVTACGDMFGQDLEDMDDALRDHLTRHENDAPQTAQAAPQALPAYPADKFTANLPAWHKSIADGKATAEKIIAKLRTVGTLTQEQVDAITPKPAAEAGDVSRMMAEAENIDALNDAAGLISAIADTAVVKELNAEYDARLETLKD